MTAHPPTNSTEALEAELRRVRQLYDTAVLNRDYYAAERKKERQRAQAAEALASTYREETEGLRPVVAELHRLSLVIESAVRHSDPNHAVAVQRLIASAKQVLTTPRTETRDV